MSQKSVEIVIGRLATDEEFRHEFRQDPQKFVQALSDHGLELTRAEVAALETLDATSFERFAETLDPRLQKASLRELRPQDSTHRRGPQGLAGASRS